MSVDICYSHLLSAHIAGYMWCSHTTDKICIYLGKIGMVGWMGRRREKRTLIMTELDGMNEMEMGTYG